MNTKTELTDEQINEIANAAEESKKPGVPDMEEIKNSVEVNPDAPLIPVQLEDSENEEKSEESSDGTIELDDDDLSNIKEKYGMDESDIIKFAECANAVNNNDEDYKVYANLPLSIKTIVDALVESNSLDPSAYETIARETVRELASDSQIDTCIKELNSALEELNNVPSVTDMYSDHMKSVMETDIQKAIDDLKEESPEKAKKLEEVRDMFNKAYDYSLAMEAYDAFGTIRKAVRKYEVNYKRSLGIFKLRISETDFKVPNVDELLDTLVFTLIEEPKEEIEKAKMEDTEPRELYVDLYNKHITKVDIEKFCVMIFKSCDNLDMTKIENSAYAYYLAKNISMLKYSINSKSNFSVELINNICNAIAFISNKETEYVRNLDKSKS